MLNPSVISSSYSPILAQTTSTVLTQEITGFGSGLASLQLICPTSTTGTYSIYLNVVAKSKSSYSNTVTSAFDGSISTALTSNASVSGSVFVYGRVELLPSLGKVEQLKLQLLNPSIFSLSNSQVYSQITDGLITLEISGYTTLTDYATLQFDCVTMTTGTYSLYLTVNKI
jgi:hypothetical protein